MCESSKLRALSVHRVSCAAGFIYHHADEWSRALARIGRLEPQALTVTPCVVVGGKGRKAVDIDQRDDGEREGYHETTMQGTASRLERRNLPGGTPAKKRIAKDQTGM